LKKINHRAAELSEINKRKREAFGQDEMKVVRSSPKAGLIQTG